VPLVEHNPAAGIKNNVLGTLYTAQAAAENGVTDFVLISTDKAVRPTNVMGASKRLAEMAVQALAADTKYAAPVRTAPAGLSASLELNMDKEAPVLTFISPLSFLGKPAGERIITVPWGQRFNQSLFPRFAVADDRDGDITSFVFVPKGAFSVLDTRTEGDYTIMLQVSDRWGNVTQETFIFRVVKA
jgi:hypothetical protein